MGLEPSLCVHVLSASFSVAFRKRYNVIVEFVVPINCVA